MPELALITREFAGVAGGGGIGTYGRNLARALAVAGHRVEVFTRAGPGGEGPDAEPFPVHLVADSGAGFAADVVEPFTRAHADRPFAVVECAEFGADGAAVMERFPALARVVKLHTASYQLGAMHHAYVTPAAKARFVAGALRRGQWPRRFWKPAVPDDAEQRLALAADAVTSPSAALLDWTARDWPLDRARCTVVPNLFVPVPELLAADPARGGPLITFVGRLEVRKGVLELARAMRKVAAALPEARLRVIGTALPHPVDGRPLDQHMRELAGPAVGRIVFTGGLPYAEIAAHLAESAVAVFPSYWEASGYTCQEAMAAGCGVIGSSAGGMADMIEPGATGLLVPPRAPGPLADAIIALLRDPARRMAMGAAARARVLGAYGADAILPMQLAAYDRALAHARQRTAVAA